MQLKDLKQGWKPVSLAVGLMTGIPVEAYSAVDQFSRIDTVLSNHATSRYIAEVNDPSELIMSRIIVEKGNKVLLFY